MHQKKGEGHDEVGEDKGEAVDDSDNEIEMQDTRGLVARGVREIIKTEFFEHRKSPMEIADTLQTKQQLCTSYTRHRLTAFVGICKGLVKKNYGGGMNMTIEELTTLLNVWPRSSHFPDGVILLDYCLTPSMAIFFFRMNRFLETA